MKVEINSIQGVKDLSALLHDATVTARETNFDPGSRVFEAVFNRRMWETAKRRGIFRPLRMDAIHTRLLLREAVSAGWTWGDRGPDEVYEASYIDYHNGQVRIHFVTDELLAIQVERLNGEIEDLDEPWEDPNPPGSLWFGRD